MAVNEIGIVSIPVSDQNRAKRFYTGWFGFSIVAGRPNIAGTGQNWTMLRPSGGSAVALVSRFDTIPAGRLRGLMISTDGVDGEYEQLKAGGVDIDKIKSAPQTRCHTSFRDSEGNGLVIQQNA